MGKQLSLIWEVQQFCGLGGANSSLWTHRTLLSSLDRKRSACVYSDPAVQCSAPGFMLEMSSKCSSCHFHPVCCDFLLAACGSWKRKAGGVSLISLLLSLIHQLGENVNFWYHGPKAYTAWEISLSDETLYDSMENTSTGWEIVNDPF